MTVSDVMRLPSMVSAEVIAGHNGLSNPVESVTVMEYGSPTETLDKLFQGNQFAGNELIISAFATIYDDVDAQCMNIRRYHEVGAVGLVLYYVGVILPEIDSRLIDLCNKLDFVLICMPRGSIKQKYSEIISEILFEIFCEKEKQRLFVSTLLDRLSNLPSHQRTMQTLLRMLSEHLRASAILVNQKSAASSIIAWPSTLLDILNDEVHDYIKKIGAGLQLKVPLHGWDCFFQRCPALLNNSDNLQLYFLKYGGPLTDDALWQASEAVRLFIHIWDRNRGEFVTEELVRAIINDEPLQKNRLASLFHIDVECLDQMWLFVPETKNLPHDAELLNLCTEYLSGISPSLLISYYDENLVAFTQAPKSAAERHVFSKELTYQLSGIGENHEIACFDCLQNTSDARKAYLDGVKYIDTARKLYPQKNILCSADISFAKHCQEALNDSAILSQYSLILEKLSKNNPDLIETLSVFLLDANSNMAQTAKLLYVHLNTVKYRLHQIQDLLGYNPNQLPDAYTLYMAVALKRLMEY